MVSAVIGFVILPWNLYNSPIVIVYFLGALGAFLGPLFGIVMADYWLIRKQQVDVPVSREEVNVTREPMNERASNVTLGEQTETVTLHEERPVVDKETVAVERVGLDVDEVRDTERVQTEVAHEEVEVDTDGTRGRTGDRDVDAARGRTADRDGDGHTIDDKARDFKNKH